jgi:hypothetical protein
MEAMIGVRLAQALERGRGRYNALFAEARRARPALDGSAFLDFLRRRVDPVVAAMGEIEPAELDATTGVLYEGALALFAKSWVGPNARHAEFEALWCELLTGSVRFVAREPAKTVGSLSNALCNLFGTPRARPSAWCRAMAATAPHCETAPQLLAAGQIAAWLSGMTHYREQALAIAATVPEPVLRTLLGCLAGPGADGAVALEAIKRDPWSDGSPQAAQGLRIVAEPGGFRGFGAEFLRPPRVASDDENLFVSDGSSCWLLLADAFGSVLHRAGSKLPAKPGKGSFALERDGTVRSPSGERKSFPRLAGASSFASTSVTLAVTLAHSHRVFLVAGIAA